MTTLTHSLALLTFVRRTMTVLLAAIVACAALDAGEAQDRERSVLTSDVAALRREIAKLQQDIETLRAENAALQRENESLRRLLSTRSADKPANPKETNGVQQAESSRPASSRTQPKTNTLPATTQRPAAASQNAAYRISTSSGLRHNRGCKYYRNSGGRPCGPTEGKACKLCGG